jgi:hypothetical protein
MVHTALSDAKLRIFFNLLFTTTITATSKLRWSQKPKQKIGTFLKKIKQNAPDSVSVNSLLEIGCKEFFV